MIGLAIGAAALFGFAAMRRHHWRHACAYGPGRHGWDGSSSEDWGPPPWGPPWARGRRGHGRWGRGGGGFHRRAWMWAVLDRLDLSPAQEKLVRSEVEQFIERVRGLRAESKTAREDLARAVSGDVFDQSALNAMFERQDTAIVELRAAVTGALGRIHEALDAKQREALSELLAGGMFRGGGFGGPYRV
jgi:Spy/CpxP family protein refolding chaperone